MKKRLSLFTGALVLLISAGSAQAGHHSCVTYRAHCVSQCYQPAPRPCHAHNYGYGHCGDIIYPEPAFIWG